MDISELGLLDNMLGNMPESGEYYEEFYDEEEFNKEFKKRNKGTGKKGKCSEVAVKVRKDDELGEWKYRLPREGRVKIESEQHNIEYKQQKWGVGSREVEYVIRLVTLSGKAKSIANKIGADEKLASSGEERWYEIVTYEAVPRERVYLGYIRVYEKKDGQLGWVLSLSEEALEVGCIDRDTAKAEIKAEMRAIMGTVRKLKRA